MSENQSKNTAPLLEIKNLTVHYETEAGVVEAVNDVSLVLEKGESLALVGETGAGKTTIALSVMKQLPSPPARIVDGTISLAGNGIFDMSEKELRNVRGSTVSMIFQDPMTALNPSMRVGDQVAEVIRLHKKCSKAEAVVLAKETLGMVGIQPNRLRDYPHQFSGGMRQRVVIAIALACEPELLIADEPTTALDVTIQAQVLDLIRDLRKNLNTSMLLITHDFGIVAEMCDRCAIIYAGQIVESGSVRQIFTNYKHPYTKGLFESIPSLEGHVDRLKPIRGLMANPMELPPYCSFSSRCDFCSGECQQKDPELIEVEPGHFVRCYNYDKIGGATP